MRPDVLPPIDETTGKPVNNVKERISALINHLEKEKTKIIIPAPALSELLVRAGDKMHEIVNTIEKSPVFIIEPFDTKAAIEVAIMTRQAKDGGNKKNGLDIRWAEIKYDRQIIAIAKVNRATTIYSDDKHIRSLAEKAKINVIRLVDLPIPEGMLQQEMELVNKYQADSTDKIEQKETDHEE